MVVLNFFIVLVKFKIVLFRILGNVRGRVMVRKMMK